MLSTERLLLLLSLLLTTTSAMLYKRHKNRSPSQPLSHSLSSQLLDMRKQLEAAQKSKIEYASGSKWSRNVCRAHLLTLELEPPLKLAGKCNTVAVLSYGCRGSCSSYSQTDLRNTTHIIHSCSCCQPLRFVVSMALLPCKKGKNIRVPFREAVACSCRPCYAEEATKDFFSVNELLKKPAVEMSLPLG